MQNELKFLKIADSTQKTQQEQDEILGFVDNVIQEQKEADERARRERERARYDKD